MVLPVILVALAMTAGMVVAYGTHPNWAQYSHGLDVIVWSRTLQWPLVGVSLILCVILIGLVIAGKRRAWWLIGLGPVLALFMHSFDDASRYSMGIVEDPPYVSAGEANFLHPEDYVVGVEFGDSAYAYPFSVLYRTPVVIQSEQARRMMLMWSAFANRAVAVNIGRQLKLRDLEIVSSPANAILLYDSRLGQFINGLKGETVKGLRPVGFHSPIATSKMRWQEWRALHPGTRVMLSPVPDAPPGPTEPVMPYYKMPPMKLDVPANTRVAVIATTRPVAVASEEIADAPINVPVADLPVLLFRDRTTGSLRAFDRRLDNMTPTFLPGGNSLRPGAVLADKETHTLWSAAGTVVESENPALKGKKLARLWNVEDDLNWGVMKFWYPELTFFQPPPAPAESTVSGGGPAFGDKPAVKAKARQRIRRPRHR